MTVATFLPVIGNGPVIVPQADEPERELFAFMKEHPEQKRLMLTWHGTLAAVAYYRCREMATRDFFSHVDPEGKGPNFWAEYHDYKLPAHYLPSDDFNCIESIAAYGSPSDVWAVLMDSEGHRTHLLGLNDFFAAQTNIGVGYFEMEGSRWGKYYSVISAPPEPS